MRIRLAKGTLLAALAIALVVNNSSSHGASATSPIPASQPDRDAVIRACLAELKAVRSDDETMTPRAVEAVRTLGEYRATEAAAELVRIIRVRKLRVPGVNAFSADRVPYVCPAAAALMSIGLPGARACLASIETAGARIDEQTAELYAYVIYDVLGYDHAKAWLLEEREHCPAGTEVNYDKILATDVMKLIGEKKYRRQAASAPTAEASTQAVR